MMTRNYVKGSVAERFWAKVNKNGAAPAHLPDLGPCWVWTDHLNDAGYGMLKVGPTSSGPKRAHRVAWELANGPTKFLVLHKCDNRACVRLDHLFVGTHTDNVADKIIKGRQLKGADLWNTKLTAELVDKIRSHYAKGGISQSALARIYGLSHQHVSDLINKKKWR